MEHADQAPSKDTLVSCFEKLLSKISSTWTKSLDDDGKTTSYTSAKIPNYVAQIKITEKVRLSFGYTNINKPGTFFVVESKSNHSYSVRGAPFFNEISTVVHTDLLRAIKQLLLITTMDRRCVRFVKSFRSPLFPIIAVGRKNGVLAEFNKALKENFEKRGGASLLTDEGTIEFVFTRPAPPFNLRNSPPNIKFIKKECRMSALAIDFWTIPKIPVNVEKLYNKHSQEVSYRRKFRQVL